jgi:hypothetical protein
LSNGFDILQSLFDSAVIGQAVAGVDLRNSGGERTVGYENQCALYSFFELNTEWRRDGQLWQPFVDGYPLNTIHMHSKTLSCFLSDRADVPCADYSAEEVHAALLAINAEKPME